jgi:predicted nucleic acid-binding protein
VKTAVDSSVLLDVLGADARFGERSREALRVAYRRGALVACYVVWAEIVAGGVDAGTASGALDRLGIRFDPLSRAAAELAGSLWRDHRLQRSGEARARIVPDFMVGAHAKLQADRLLTRDRGFYRTYFAGLEIVDPSLSR